MWHIHIVACGPRTGTTLLGEMMGACLNIDVRCAHERSLLAPPPHAGRIYLSKHSGEAGIALRELERRSTLCVIYVLRDPRDSIVSRHSLDPHRYWAGLNFWKHLSPVGRLLEWQPRVATVRYEDLVTAPDKTQEKLLEFFPFLKKNAAFSEYDRAAVPSQPALRALGGLRPVSASSIGNWQRHLPRVAGQLLRHGSLTADLVEHGYEINGDWTEQLCRVEPDMSQSYWSEGWPPHRVDNRCAYR
jgi:hypothetical protein